MDEKDFGKNISSGAEKVESIERRAELERQAAERRVEEARAKAQRNRERESRYREALHELERERKAHQASNGQGGANGGNQEKNDVGTDLAVGLPPSYHWARFRWF